MTADEALKLEMKTVILKYAKKYKLDPDNQFEWLYPKHVAGMWNALKVAGLIQPGMTIAGFTWHLQNEIVKSVAREMQEFQSA